MRLTELRKATWAEHKMIERALDLFRPSFTIAQYANLLVGYREFLRCWEPRILDVLASAMPGFAGPRMKLAWVDLDLRNLERRHRSQVPRDCDGFWESVPTPLLADRGEVRGGRAPKLPTLRSVAQALGSMYVMEGSTLGGQIISRHFEKHLGVTPTDGCGYLGAYGRDTGSMWKGFCAVLESRPPEEDPEMAEAAIETFQALREWLPADRATPDSPEETTLEETTLEETTLEETTLEETTLEKNTLEETKGHAAL